MKKYSIYLWAVVTIAFISFIGLMSYWYPVTLDEYFRWGVPFRWEMVKDSFTNIVPRISVFFIIPIFALGKWSFILSNSVVQLANCLCLFYIVFARLPRIKDLQDMPYFLMILCMSIFFICRPSEVIFWLSGSVNYSWTVLFFLLVLCFLRQIQTGKFILKDNWFLKSCMLVLGFIVGMSNEGLAPTALGFAVCVALFFEYKKIKTPRALSFLIFGIAIGCLVFFSAPAHYNKMSSYGLSKISSISVIKKIFFHLYHIDFILKCLFYYPAIVFLGLIICSLDKDKRNFKDENFYLSLISFALGAFLSFILVFAPAPVRAYYSASVMFLLSFVFFARYLIVIYGFDFSKWLCYLILGVSLFLAPRFVLPHYSLYFQDKFHAYLASQPKPITPPYLVLKGPTYNLSIGLTDPARRVSVGEGMYITDVSPLVNW